jgi:3D (Asp-Asp-Asp) domain-containing protein
MVDSDMGETSNSFRRGLTIALLLFSSITLLVGCAESYRKNDSSQTLLPEDELSEPQGAKHTLTVTASAYNSLPGQTSGNPSIAAWGDRLKPGMKAIAVSSDLLHMGLDHRTEVEIEGLPGTYVVLDRMHHRWRQKIDIYMGVNRPKALNWGKRKVKITWYDEQDVADATQHGDRKARPGSS